MKPLTKSQILILMIALKAEGIANDKLVPILMTIQEDLNEQEIPYDDLFHDVIEAYERFAIAYIASKETMRKAKKS